LTQGNTDISTLAAEPSAYVDQALAVWDKKRSKLATKYLGRGIRKELNNRKLMNRMFPRVAVLATLTEQPEVVISLFRAFIIDVSDLREMNFLGWEIVGPFRWCAEQLNLTGYHDFFDETIEYNGFRRLPASREITQPVTREDRMTMGWLGTVEEPAPTWVRSPVPRLDHLLRDMCLTATYRQYPYFNDLGWSLDDYDAELREDARFARARLGFTPDMPTFPENPEIHLPEGMTRMPRLSWNT
jgi:hypothetical protein